MSLEGRREGRREVGEGREIVEGGREGGEGREGGRGGREGGRRGRGREGGRAGGRDDCYTYSNSDTTNPLSFPPQYLNSSHILRNNV